ncbi:LysM peptidoglycan-binding domain-containing protein [Marinobacterium jannaschii]|uniref:LysM peptidoglycan-binding domain-containing protein n=1 Tax=Marinobacterium jannaschii TaxID=64970 RepID=UPI000688E0DC|nr:LysM domain-containing protein [Marinobacterium jannaschii]
MTIVFKYSVQPGDSLSAIANNISRSSGVSGQSIATANGLADANLISLGQTLKIPCNDGAAYWNYQVGPGDTLSTIAAKIGRCRGLSWSQIAAANPDINPDIIHAGQRLLIPATEDPAATATTSTSTDATGQPAVAAEHVGYWDWTWTDSAPLPGADIAIAFSGWADVDKAITDSARCRDSLQGERYISLGGGSETTGAFSRAFLDQIDQAIVQGRFSGYKGLAYDIETGEAGLANAFAASFKRAKAAGFKVLVTVSHSAPYGIADRVVLMESLFSDGNIDFISPQLYSSGQESHNDYADPALSWSQYSAAKAKIIPSLVSATNYPDAQRYFAAQGVTLSGYIQWKQAG